jgi:hypothetical protein
VNDKQLPLEGQICDKLAKYRQIAIATARILTKDAIIRSIPPRVGSTVGHHRTGRFITPYLSTDSLF